MERQDVINKFETLIGYLEYLTSKRTLIQNAADEIVAVIEEAKEYVESLKPKAKNK